LSLETVTKISAEREKTDSVMSVWLPLIYVSLFTLPLILALPPILEATREGVSLDAVPSLISLAPIFNLISLIVLGLQLFIIYRWILRKEQHKDRALRLYSAIADFYENQGSEDIATKIRSVLRDMGDVKKGKRWEWWIVALAGIGILGFFDEGGLVVFGELLLLIFISRFLNRDFCKHDSYEKEIWDIIGEGVKATGKSLNSLEKFSFGKFPYRSTAVFVALSIVTFGVFWYYWAYTLTRDPNLHFHAHSQVEDELIHCLEEV